MQNKYVYVGKGGSPHWLKKNSHDKKSKSTSEISDPRPGGDDSDPSRRRHLAGVWLPPLCPDSGAKGHMTDPPVSDPTWTWILTPAWVGVSVILSLLIPIAYVS